jgi:hypothetical protein
VSGCDVSLREWWEVGIGAAEDLAAKDTCRPLHFLF